MKSSKKVLSYVLSLAMIISLVSAMAMTSFAAAGDATEVSYDGTDYPIPAAAMGLADATTLASIKDAATIIIEMSDADLKAIDGTTTTFQSKVTPDDVTAITWMKETGTLTGAITTIDGNAASITSVAVGDVIWMLDTKAGANNVARIVIASMSSGEIIGDSTKTAVPFNVVIPLVIDFAIDPFELADKSAIAGADYTVTNKTPTYPVKVNFTITKETKAGGAELVDSVEDLPTDATKAAYMEVVNAQTVTIGTGADANKVTAASYDAVGTTEAAKTLNLARRTKAFTATADDAATAPGEEIKNYFALAGYTGTSVVAANASSFTFRGSLNTKATYEPGDLKVKALWTVDGMGVKKYTNEVKPLMQGAGSYAFEVADYGFVDDAGTNGLTNIQNAPYYNKVTGNTNAGYADFAFAADDLEDGVDIEFNFNGTKVTGIFINVNGQGAEVTDFFTVDEDAGTITLAESWADADDTFELFIGLDNNEVWAVTALKTPLTTDP